MSEYPRRHQVRPELGITEEVALKLDQAAAKLESGDSDGAVSNRKCRAGGTRGTLDSLEFPL